jgi:sec-independent protein translocase protein TatC
LPEAKNSGIIVLNPPGGTSALVSGILDSFRPMANRYDEDDLFKHTSMTFGEHLEELRVSLFKAVLAIVIGFGIGLCFGGYVVQLIQAPLERALAKYNSDEALEYFNAHVPPELQDNPEAKTLIFQEKLLPEVRFVAPGEMLSELKKKFPQDFSGKELTIVPPKTAPDKPEPEKAGQDKAIGDKGLKREDMIQVFFWRPMSEDERGKLEAFNVQEPFMIYIKAAFVSGVVMSSPVAFYFLWSFVAAGLYPHEKKYVHLFLPISIGLFFCGAALAFVFVFPPVLGFFFGVSKSLGYTMRPRISEWMSFVLLLPLGFGISFQLPLVMLFLERIHVFTTDVYLSKWRIAVLIMAIASMVLSPGGDPYSMMMMLIPLIGLYFGGILLCKWLPSNRTPATSEAKEYASVD